MSFIAGLTVGSKPCVCMYSVDEMQQLLTDDDKLQEMLASRIDEVNDVQQKVVLFIEKFASEFSLVTRSVVIFINAKITHC